MNWKIDRTKTAIRDHSVFNGLAVDDRAKFERLFLHPDFKLAVLGEPAGYVIFEEYKGKFVFHLVNFTEIGGQGITEDVLQSFVVPYCIANGLDKIQARSERRGMGRKLEKNGMVGQGNVFIGEVSNVF